MKGSYVFFVWATWWCSAVHCFWQVKFSCGRLRTTDLVTLNFQANKHWILTTSPQLVGPSASSAISSTGHKPCTALEHVGRLHRRWIAYLAIAPSRRKTGKYSGCHNQRSKPKVYNNFRVCCALCSRASSWRRIASSLRRPRQFPCA